jgi:hypothetical protein
MNPQVAASLRKEYELLSNEAHGRAQHLAVYEDLDGRFRWPPVAPHVDPRRIRSMFMTTLVVLLAAFGILHWMVRDWAKLGEINAETVDGYYVALTGFVLDHVDHGNWQP